MHMRAKTSHGKNGGPPAAELLVAAAESREARRPKAGNEMSARRKRRKVSSGAAVALVSDTHGVVDEILLAGLRNQPLDAVIHPGDIGDVKRKSRLSGEQVLQALQAAAGGAALSAVLGNVDEPDAALVGNGSVGLTAVVEQLGIRMLITATWST